MGWSQSAPPFLCGVLARGCVDFELGRVERAGARGGRASVLFDFRHASR
jgi:hypothetical protein